MKIRVSTIAVGILSLISGIAVGYSIGKTNSSEEEMKNKMLKYYVTLNNWIGKKQKNINPVSYTHLERTKEKTNIVYFSRTNGNSSDCKKIFRNHFR